MRSYSTAPSTGLSGPAANPPTASAASVTGSDGSVASTSSITDQVKKQPTNTERRGSRWPTAPYASAPTKAAPPNVPSISPSVSGPPNDSRAITGKTTGEIGPSRQFVMSTVITIALSRRSPATKRRPSASCEKYRVGCLLVVRVRAQ